MKWMLLPYRRYFDFTGRSRRMEYWMFQLLWLIVFFVSWLIIGAAATIDDDQNVSALVVVVLVALVLFGLGSFIPGIAVQVRRFHDQDKSGLLILLNFVPMVGGIIVLVFMFLEGTKGENSYGPDPKGRGEADVFS